MADRASRSEEWAPYRCEIPAPRRAAGRSDCAVLTDVYHVAHVADARRIIEDNRLRARIVRQFAWQV
jgi:hypothetical protein